MQAPKPKIFISYSRADEKYRDTLLLFLKGRDLNFWYDGMIAPGTPWEEKIASALEQAHVAVLLVSPDFMATDFIQKFELPALLGRHDLRGSLIWIPCRPVDVRGTPLGRLQAASSPDQPLSGLKRSSREKVLSEIVRKIETIAGKQLAATSEETYLEETGASEKQEHGSLQIRGPGDQAARCHVPGRSQASLGQLLADMLPSTRMRQVIGLDVDNHIAIDDGLLFERAPYDRDGWRPNQIRIDLAAPFGLSNELKRVAEQHRCSLAPPNKIKYAVTKLQTALNDQVAADIRLRMCLAPISYYDIRGVEMALDEPIGPGQQSWRERYFRDHALFRASGEGPYLPNKVVVHILVVSRDEKFLIMQRSKEVEFQNNQWSASFEEQMQGEYVDELTGKLEPADSSLGAAAARGLREEMGIEIDDQAIPFLGICSEYENLAYNIIGIANVNVESSEIIARWKLCASDKKEHKRIVALPFERDFVVSLIRNPVIHLPEHHIHGGRWHATSRLRVLLGALHFGLLGDDHLTS